MALGGRALDPVVRLRVLCGRVRAARAWTRRSPPPPPEGGEGAFTDDARVSMYSEFRIVSRTYCNVLHCADEIHVFRFVFGCIAIDSDRLVIHVLRQVYSRVFQRIAARFVYIVRAFVQCVEFV